MYLQLHGTCRKSHCIWFQRSISNSHAYHLVQVLIPNHTKTRWMCKLQSCSDMIRWCSWLGQEKATVLRPLRQSSESSLYKQTGKMCLFSCSNMERDPLATAQIYLDSDQAAPHFCVRLFRGKSGHSGYHLWPCAFLRWLFPAIHVSLGTTSQLWQLWNFRAHP